MMPLSEITKLRIDNRAMSRAIGTFCGQAQGLKRWRAEFEDGHEIDCKYENADEMHDESAPYSWSLTMSIPGAQRVVAWGWVPSMTDAVRCGVAALVREVGEGPGRATT
jgi:hypothetical protein